MHWYKVEKKSYVFISRLIPISVDCVNLIWAADNLLTVTQTIGFLMVTESDTQVDLVQW